MKRLLVNLALITTTLFGATACTERTAEERMQTERLSHERAMRRIDASENVHIAIAERPRGPVSPGNYGSHIGNPLAGYWSYGNWIWNPGLNPYREETNSYYDYRISVGGLAAGALVGALDRSSWERNNPRGYQKTTVVVNNYTSVSGKTISKAKFTANNKAAKKKHNKWKKNSDAKRSTYSKGGAKYKKMKHKQEMNKKTAKPAKPNKPAKTYNKPAKTYNKPAKQSRPAKSSYSSRSSSSSRTSSRSSSSRNR